MPLAPPVRARPWKADGYTDRATGTDAVRYTSVDTVAAGVLEGDGFELGGEAQK